MPETPLDSVIAMYEAPFGVSEQGPGQPSPGRLTLRRVAVAE